MSKREVVGILGKTGFGKSVWSRRYTAKHKRLFAFDPLMETDVEYLSKDDLINRYDEGDFLNGKSFRVGIHDPENLPIMGAISFVSTNTMMLIEECAIAFETTYGQMDSWLRELIFLGRHRRGSVIFVAQRAVSIPIAARSQFTRLISFSQHEGNDVDWLKTYFGIRVSEIPALDYLECLDSHKGKISRYKIPYDFPKKNHDLRAKVEKQRNFLDSFDG